MNKLFKMAGSLALAAVLTSGAVSPVYAEEEKQPVLTVEEAQEALDNANRYASYWEAIKDETLNRLATANDELDALMKKIAVASAAEEAALDAQHDALIKKIDELEEKLKENETRYSMAVGDVTLATLALEDAKKAVNPEVKPEVNPEVKPEVNPEVKPEVNPEVKPEVKVNEKTADGRKAAVSTSVK